MRIYPQETPDVIYTDEDNCVGKKRIRPFFKPDMSKNMLLNFQYMGRCFVVKRSLLEIIEENKERFKINMIISPLSSFMVSFPKNKEWSAKCVARTLAVVIFAPAALYVLAC